MEDIIKIIRLLFAISLFQSCALSKSGNDYSSCSRQFSYKTNKIDIQGITVKLKKAGIEYADLGISSITIDPKITVVTEKLQQLDLFQYSVCQQIKSLSPSDSLTISLKEKYITSLIDMMRIAQNQDSLLKK